MPAAQLYDTLCDVVILTEAQRVDPATGLARGEGLKLNPAFLRPHMHVVDLTQMSCAGPFAEEARLRGCKVVESADILAETLGSIFKTITARDLDAGVVRETAERLRATQLPPQE